SRLDLSYAYPLVAFSYVLVTVLAWRFLGETVPTLRWAGLAIIMVGVMVFAMSHRQTPPKPLPSAVETEVAR
ncbi:MAG TPA: hypothetical protein QGH10_16815, partial [Armatimonadota bacterium]|nr:hypothetical protein [Armatimonadota bacterium]